MGAFPEATERRAGERQISAMRVLECLTHPVLLHRLKDPPGSFTKLYFPKINPNIKQLSRYIPPQNGQNRRSPVNKRKIFDYPARGLVFSEL